MVPILRSQRLELRSLQISDQDAMVELIMSDMDVMQWLPGSDEVSTPAGQRKVALEYIAHFTKPWAKHGFGMWALCIADAELGTLGDFIGYCGFLPEQIKGAGPEIAYAIGKPQWGKGLATEAVTTCMDWIFNETEVSCLHAVADKENTASRNVIEKMGMRHESDVDLYDSVANGAGLLPFYTIEREVYLKKAFFL